MSEGNKVTELGDIPSDWNVVKQGEVATFYNGRAYKISEWETEGTPVIRLQNLTGSGTEYYYSNLKLPDSQYCHSGDLLYMWSATFGPVWWKNGKAIYHYHIWKVEVEKNLLNKVFHYYLLYDITVKMKSQSHGSTMLHVTKGGMEKFKIPLPPLPEQQKIASILSTVDEKIEVIDAQISQTQELKKGLMQQLLSKGIGHTKFKSSELGDIPESWEVVELGDVLEDLRSGLSRKLSMQDIGLPVIRSNNLDTEEVSFEDIKYWYTDDPQGAHTKDYFLNDGDILISFINSNAQIGKSAMFFNKMKRPVIYTTNILKLTVKQGVSRRFIYYCTKTSPYLKFIKLITKPAVNQASFTTKDFKKLLVALPKLEEQQAIASVLNTIDEKLSSLQSRKESYQQLKKGLMQQLLTGKIRVNTSQNESALA